MLPFEVTKYTIEDAPVLREMAIAANPAMKPMIDMMSDEQLVDTFNSMLQESKSTYEGNLAKLGYVNLDKPTMISIYPRDFEAKEQIVELINQYNNQQEKSDKITYTDTVALLMSSVTTIINAISYVHHCHTVRQ